MRVLFSSYLKANARAESYIVTTAIFPRFYTFTTGQEPQADTFTSTDQSLVLIQAELSLQISPSSLKPSNLVGMICASFTVSTAGKSIQPTLLARKIIMITQTALPWSIIAILSFSVGNNSVVLPFASVVLQYSAVSLCRLTTNAKVFPAFQDGTYCLSVYQNLQLHKEV